MLLMKDPMTALIMFDLSAAFNVIDHSILLKRLKFSIGIKENFNLGKVVHRPHRVCFSGG